jgi:signal transduction histidine kinase
MSGVQIAPPSPGTRKLAFPTLRWPSARACAGVLVLAAAYYAAAKLGQTLRYTGSVSAIWPPAGVGIAALYLFGLRWWPGIFIGELLVNGELLVDHADLPFGSLAGQQAGNMAEVLVGAWLLHRFIGPRAALDRVSQVGGLILAAGTATAISATAGTLSMLSGGVIDRSEVPLFWRTWMLGDTAGALVVLPLVLTWLRDPTSAWRRLRTLEGAALIGVVSFLAVVAAVSTDEPLTYLVFPALIWAAFRFGPPGATLATAIIAGITIGITADDLGVFFKQPIDDRTVSTQLYLLVAALTALYLSAVVSERARSAAQLSQAKRREIELALDERRRIARELHDSVSQALFSSGLHTRTAQKALEAEDGELARRVGQTLQTVGELTKRAQNEMRRFIFAWGPEGIGDGLVPALAQHASAVEDGGLRVEVDGPDARLPLTLTEETQLYGIGREALANVIRHAGASTARIRVESGVSRVTVEIEDDGCGFDSAPTAAGHYGLESMRSRAEEIGAALTISSSVGHGTLVRVEVPVHEGRSDAG